MGTTRPSPHARGQPRLADRQLRTEAGETGCAFAGFDFPNRSPGFRCQACGHIEFPCLLTELGHNEWKDFYSVCDESCQISVRRPFYPNGAYKGRRKEDLFRGHGVSSLEPLLRRCERGGNGHKQACCLFWTLGGNQVGKAAIVGWRDVLAPALRDEANLTMAVRWRPAVAAGAGKRHRCGDVPRRVLCLVLRRPARQQAKAGEQEKIRRIAPQLGPRPRESRSQIASVSTFSGDSRKGTMRSMPWSGFWDAPGLPRPACARRAGRAYNRAGGRLDSWKGVLALPLPVTPPSFKKLSFLKAAVRPRRWQNLRAILRTTGDGGRAIDAL